MSEQQNVSLVQTMFEAFGRGDVQTILDNCAVDCEFYFPGPAVIPYAGTKTGRVQIQAYFDAILGTQSGQNLRIEKYVAQGDTVVAIGSYTAVVDSTGKTIESPVVLTFEIQGGKVRRHTLYGDTAAVAAGYSGVAAAAGT